LLSKPLAQCVNDSFFHKVDKAVKFYDSEIKNLDSFAQQQEREFSTSKIPERKARKGQQMMRDVKKYVEKRKAVQDRLDTDMGRSINDNSLVMYKKVANIRNTQLRSKVWIEGFSVEPQ